ncbi:MAG TPA: DUF6174 domain-containing protein [Pirellulales bacterium]|nr:DUF6174 domain-containing protein [Pirellulales bacterium]
MIGCALMLVGMVLGTIGTGLVLRTRSLLPPLTADGLAAAEERWKEHESADYNMDVEIGGRQPGHFHVEVRSGRATKVTRNGVEPQRRTWDTWTVPGMFDTLEQELDLAARPEGAFGQPGARAVMRALFDPELGLPRRYERFVLGTAYEVRWQVTRFETVGP